MCNFCRVFTKINDKKTEEEEEENSVQIFGFYSIFVACGHLNLEEQTQDKSAKRSSEKKQNRM